MKFLEFFSLLFILLASILIDSVVACPWWYGQENRVHLYRYDNYWGGGYYDDATRKPAVVKTDSRAMKDCLYFSYLAARKKEDGGLYAEADAIFKNIVFNYGKILIYDYTRSAKILSFCRDRLEFRSISNSQKYFNEYKKARDLYESGEYHSAMNAFKALGSKMVEPELKAYMLYMEAVTEIKRKKNNYAEPGSNPVDYDARLKLQKALELVKRGSPLSIRIQFYLSDNNIPGTQISCIDDIILNHPQHYLADDALFKKGDEFLWNTGRTSLQFAGLECMRSISLQYSMGDRLLLSMERLAMLDPEWIRNIAFGPRSEYDDNGFIEKKPIWTNYLPLIAEVIINSGEAVDLKSAWNKYKGNKVGNGDKFSENLKTYIALLKARKAFANNNFKEAHAKYSYVAGSKTPFVPEAYYYLGKLTHDKEWHLKLVIGYPASPFSIMAFDSSLFTADLSDIGFNREQAVSFLKNAEKLADMGADYSQVIKSIGLPEENYSKYNTLLKEFNLEMPILYFKGDLIDLTVRYPNNRFLPYYVPMLIYGSGNYGNKYKSAVDSIHPVLIKYFVPTQLSELSDLKTFYWREGKYRKCIEFGQMLRQKGIEPDFVNRMIGDSYARLDECAEALKYYPSALAFEKLGRFPEACKAYSAAKQYDDARFLACSLMGTKDLAQASIMCTNLSFLKFILINKRINGGEWSNLKEGEIPTNAKPLRGIDIRLKNIMSNSDRASLIYKRAAILYKNPYWEIYLNSKSRYSSFRDTMMGEFGQEYSATYGGDGYWTNVINCPYSQLKAYYTNINNLFVADSALNEIINNYPSSPEAPKALYTQALIWGRLSGWNQFYENLTMQKKVFGFYFREKSIECYHKLALKYPKSNLADDALFWEAWLKYTPLINYDYYTSKRTINQENLKNMRKALDLIKNVYPDGDVYKALVSTEGFSTSRFLWRNLYEPSTK